MTSTQHDSTRCIIDTPGHNVDLFYATRFECTDPVIYLEHRGTKLMILNDLEIDRARATATVHRVLSITTYTAPLAAANLPTDTAHVVARFCREQRIRRLLVPASTAASHVDTWRRLGLRVELAPSPFYEARFFKTPTELAAMRAAQRVTFAAIRRAESILRDATIKGRRLVWRGAPLTSERLRAELMAFLFQQNYECPDGMIIAGGAHAIDPHDRGSGPLRPNEAIIVDIFPRSLRSGFYGDATRTFCRGTAPEALRQLYATVRQAQEWGLRQVRANLDGKTIHTGIVKQFETAGYATGERDGRRQGFIHGTGHGLGLAIHEEPLRINKSSCRLRARHVVTVEPGLYYKGIGGVRIEDVVAVTARGADLLATYPKRLEIRS